MYWRQAQVGIPPHAASAFTDSSDLQLRVVCDMPSMPWAQATEPASNIKDATPTAPHGTAEPGWQITVLATASRHEEQILPLLFLSPGLLHRAGWFQSGKALNARGSPKTAPNSTSFRIMFRSSMGAKSCYRVTNGRGRTGEHILPACNYEQLQGRDLVFLRHTRPS